MENKCLRTQGFHLLHGPSITATPGQMDGREIQEQNSVIYKEGLSRGQSCGKWNEVPWGDDDFPDTARVKE